MIDNYCLWLSVSNVNRNTVFDAPNRLRAHALPRTDQIRLAHERKPSRRGGKGVEMSACTMMAMTHWRYNGIAPGDIESYGLGIIYLQT